MLRQRPELGFLHHGVLPSKSRTGRGAEADFFGHGHGLHISRCRPAMGSLLLGLLCRWLLCRRHLLCQHLLYTLLLLDQEGANNSHLDTLSTPRTSICTVVGAFALLQPAVPM